MTDRILKSTAKLFPAPGIIAGRIALTIAEATRPIAGPIMAVVKPCPVRAIPNIMTENRWMFISMMEPR